MRYRLSDIISLIHAEAIPLHADAEIRQVCTDTRQITAGASSLFFCLVARNDGHLYIDPAYRKGIRHFVVSRTIDTHAYPDAHFLKVQDTLQALQDLAAAHRQGFHIPVIGITGSNGKTIIKEWLFQLLSPEKNIVKSPKSYNSQIGVPLSVLNMEAQHELAIFEAGISTTHEMEHLQHMIQPTLGIFTNIGTAHDAGFSNRQEKVKEKLQLFRHCETILYSDNYPEIRSGIADAGLTANTISFGEQASSTLRIRKLKTEEQHTLLEIESKIFGIDAALLRLPFTDAASLENCLCCVLTLLYFGYDVETIQQRILALRNLPMRLELKYGINNCTIIDDSYSADFHSLQVAMDFFRQQETHKKRTLILSEFEGSGLNEKEFIAGLKALLQQHPFDKLIGVGTSFMHHIEALAYSVKEWYVFENAEKLLEQFHVLNFENELILLKGARKFGFERITAQLIGQTHATVLEINLNALTHNLNFYKSYLGKDCGVIAMVKAFSYGSGSTEVASLLEKQHIGYLAVAYADEGVHLRRNGIHTRIMVMNPDAVDFERMLEYQLEPEIYSLQILQELIHAVRGQNIDVHLKLETGMNRLGFVQHDIDALIGILRGHPNIRVKTIFSHLAASEDPQFDTFTLEQIAIYEQLSSEILRHLDHPVKRHLLNSSGILRFPQAHYDYVRLGIGLYGVDSTHTIQSKLQTIGTLKTRVAQIKQVPKGQTVGYSRKGVADKDLKIAILAIGYADGYDRRLGNGAGDVFIAGQKAKIIGNICMDMCMADITHIEEVREGDEVEIYGKEISIIAQAEKIGTIAYELLTRISGRVKRLYYLD